MQFGSPLNSQLIVTSFLFVKLLRIQPNGESSGYKHTEVASWFKSKTLLKEYGLPFISLFYFDAIFGSWNKDLVHWLVWKIDFARHRVFYYDSLRDATTTSYQKHFEV